MSSQVPGIKAELSRIREAKRNAEATIELLRSDMEQGKIHLRVSENDEFRKKTAEAIVSQASAGYLTDYHGRHYADPVEGKLYFRQCFQSISPWSDLIDWRIVPVEALVNEDGNDFSPETDWDIADIPYREMAIGYLEFEGEDLEENGDIPEWVGRDDVISFARDSQWGDLLEQIEQQSHAEAVKFALLEFLDEVIVEPFDESVS